MVNVIIFISTVSVFSWAIAKFLNDVWLRDAQQKQLRQKFETWWLTVAYLDKLKLALACTIKLNGVVDSIFGETLFSKKAFYRCSVISTGILLASLSLIGLFDHATFGIEPWQNYRKSGALIKVVTQSILSESAFETKQKANSSPRSVNIIQAPLTNSLTFTNENYKFTTNGYSGANQKNTANPFEDISNSIVQLEQVSDKYNTTTLVALYSVLFFLILLLLNSALCLCSLVFSRMILREIIASARPFSTLALLVTNVFLVLNISSVFLLFLTVLSIPLIWFFLPILFGLSKQSFISFVLLLSGGEVAVWIFGGADLKLVVLIAFLPSVCAIGISLFSLAAIIWRDAFHLFISAVLLRCAEKGPLTIIVGSFTFLASCVAILAKFIHWAF